MLKRIALVLMVATTVALGGSARAQTDTAALASQVREAERAFAKTMADRNHAAFVSFLSDEAVFFGPQGAQRGKAAVAAAWKPFFDRPDAPFRGTRTRLRCSTLERSALSSGPVRTRRANASARSIRPGAEAGRGLEIVFDKGCPPCGAIRVLSAGAGCWVLTGAECWVPGARVWVLGCWGARCCVLRCRHCTRHRAPGTRPQHLAPST